MKRVANWYFSFATAKKDSNIYEMYEKIKCAHDKF